MMNWLSDLFAPDMFNDLDVGGITSAFNDQRVRAVWLQFCLDEMKRINIEVDKRLLSGPEYGIADLCARRKAFQDILEFIPTARRQVAQAKDPNPRLKDFVNLDRVTV